MNENLLDVLLYLFDNYPSQDLQDNPVVRGDLDEAGFLPEEVDDAFAWLRGTDSEYQQLAATPGSQTLRMYSDVELERLPAECRGYLILLQDNGILSGEVREVVIDRLMALSVDDHHGAAGDGVISVEQVKWVVMMVLSSQADELAYAHMEALLNADDPMALH